MFEPVGVAGGRGFELTRNWTLATPLRLSLAFAVRVVVWETKES